MPLRPPAGFIRPGFDPLKNPNAPTIGTATEGNTSASVTFTPPANVGGSAISAYYAVSNPGQVTGTGASSPVSVTGLTNGTAYTFSVWALNTYGPGPFSAASNSVTPYTPLAGDIGLFAAGNPDTGNSISYITISSTGNATDFGDLSSTDFFGGAACGSSTRSLFAAGNQSGNTIEYVNPTRPANSVFFGNINRHEYYASGFCGFSNSTRGVFAGGRDQLAGVTTNKIDYVTIASTGNSTLFGDLLNTVTGVAACASTTRGVVAGGDDSSFVPVNVIQYVTIASTGNAIDFGDLSATRAALSGCSNATRGLFAGGYNSSGTTVNNIYFITIATTGNTSSFGDLTVGRYSLAACASSTRGVFGGGRDASSNYNVLDYVTIGTAGNATDFGDLATAGSQMLATSNCHGGL